MRTIVGFTGYAGSGKDEAAKALTDKFDFRRFAFADILKTALLALDPIVYFSPTQSYVRVSYAVSKYGWTEAKARFPELRMLLQRLGTEVGRNLFSESFWVERTFAVIEKTPTYIPVVITDVRFPNEAAAIRYHGGKVYRVHRDGVGPVNDHVSDKGINEVAIDGVIYNSGTIADLHSTVIATVSHFYKRSSQRALFGEDVVKELI